jgi:uncharacterized protein YndB with AHSA1/START domain
VNHFSDPHGKMKRPTSPGKNGRSRPVPEPPAAIRVARRFSAPAERVFRAWLQPTVAGRWLFATALEPLTDVEIDPRVGGSFRFAERRDNGCAQHAGRYVELVPHRRLVFTLAMADRPHVVTRVTAEISPLKTGCELALTHENLPPDCASETEARWTGILYGLDETLNSRPRRARAG